MGGRDEKTIAGLRMHVNNEEVHIHENRSNKKFECLSTNFSQDAKRCLKELKGVNDGVVRVTGKNGVDLYILKDNGKYHIMLNNPIRIKDFESFVRKV